MYYYRNNYNYIISNGIDIVDNSFFFSRVIIFPMSWSKKFGIDLKKYVNNKKSSKRKL